MRILVRKHTAFYGLYISIACLLVGLIGFFAIASPAKADSTQPAVGDRLITVHDNGVERAFMTRASSLRQALSDAKFAIDSQDTVEPGLDSQLVASNYEVNIYRARPVTIVDGAVRQKVLSSARTSVQIAKTANITLYPEDMTSLDVNVGTTAQDTGLQMTITRATPFTFTLYGKTITARTQAKTVGDMLKEKNINLASDDRLSVDRSAPISSNLSVRVWREGKQTVTVDEAVPFTTDQVKDADQPLGYKQVQTPGVDGSQSVTYEVMIQDGKEVSRTKIASISTKQMVKQVEVVGAKLPTPTNPTEAQALGHQMMLAYGFGEDQWPCLYNLWMHESGWRVDAGNASGAYGIPQALPGSKMGVGWQTDAAAQIQWGLGYVKGRYGTPCGAWGIWQNQKWY
jgi:uncharacterized protein YabE (DUF348 family)